MKFVSFSVHLSQIYINFQLTLVKIIVKGNGGMLIPNDFSIGLNAKNARSVFLLGEKNGMMVTLDTGAINLIGTNPFPKFNAESIVADCSDFILHPPCYHLLAQWASFLETFKDRIRAR